ncbi:MAG: hypothetical protein NMNS01_27150 [Nitrosomonas sp.]|nr:MAG: hypothetical protein NMNS01_27150 [Nitrosomonas sp.]
MRSNQYSGIKKIFGRYWIAYGGWNSILYSPYFHFSLIISIVAHGAWRNASWYDLPISILPSIIGFSLGGYAIWLALGDDKFKAGISGKNAEGEDSPFIKVNAAFVHFIVLQILALIFSLGAQSRPIYNIPVNWKIAILEVAPVFSGVNEYLTYFASFFGYFLFIYAIMSALAATMAIFRIAGWLDHHHANQKKIVSKNNL